MAGVCSPFFHLTRVDIEVTVILPAIFSLTPGFLWGSGENLGASSDRDRGIWGFKGEDNIRVTLIMKLVFQ